MPKGKKSTPAPAKPAVADVPPLEEMLSFESPESSNIAGASFDPDTGLLTVRFKGHGTTPEERIYISTAIMTIRQWVDFLQCASKGEFFAGQIKPLFEFRRVS